MNEVLLDKIRKLLAMAEGTDNTNEAEAFSAKAAQLIAEHRIDPEHVRHALANGALGLRRIALGRGAYVRARLALLDAIARGHDCEVVFETGSRGTTAIVAGFEDDLDVTEMLFTSLHVQAASQMAGVRARTPAATQRWRRSFLFGFAARVAEVLAVTRADAAAVRPPTPTADVTSIGADLPDVLARTARVRAFAASSFGRVGAARAAAPAQRSAWRDGHRAGGDVDFGRTRLAGRPALEPREEMTVIDRGQAAVAAAEEAAFGGTSFDVPISRREAERAIVRITAGPWWRECGPSVVVQSPRHGTRSSSARDRRARRRDPVERRATDTRHRRPRVGSRPRRCRSGSRCAIQCRLRRRGGRAGRRIKCSCARRRLDGDGCRGG